MVPPLKLISWPITSSGVAATPPNVYIPSQKVRTKLQYEKLVFLPIIVVKADLITPTQAVVKAEFTVVHKKIE